MTTDQVRAITQDIGPCTLHGLESGEADNKTVLLLHGMKFNADTWKDLGTLEQLAGAGYHAVALEMPGFGKSPACDLDQDTVLERYIVESGLEKPVVVGPSMGGRIALEFAIRHPELICGLVLIGAVGVEENREHLADISVPTLILWGEKDQISSPENGDLLHGAITGSRKRIFAGSPHPCYLDKPADWHRELLDFLPTCG